METVTQPTSNPSRKLAAATIATAIMSVVGMILRNKFPEWYDPEVMAALGPVVVFIVGYVVKDNDNSGLSPLAKEVGKVVDAELPADAPVEIVTPPDQPNIVIEAKP